MSGDSGLSDVVGDDHGLPLPRTPEDLRAAGAPWLTEALRTAGTLRAANRVSRVSEVKEVSGGSTGRKALLGVEYADRAPHLHTELFVKFSRDLVDPARDVGRTQMEQEVRLAELSRHPAFPVVVPETLFADYHRDSGTGILISERIMFGANGIEPHYPKCLDYEMPDQLEHYRVLITALARLAGTERAGRFPPELIARFPTDLQAATVGERPDVDADRLTRKVERLVEFVAAQRGLFRPFVRDEKFLAGLPSAAAAISAREPGVWRLLEEDADYLALCHWNANVDNAWFFQDLGGHLRCGLLDWGCVGRMHVAMALWGVLCGAESTLWDRHLDELLELFVTEYRAAGGPDLDVGHLCTRLMQYVAVMGVAWLLDVPARLRAKLGDAMGGLTRADSRIVDDEALRAPLQMLTNVLDLWQRFDFGEMFAELR